MTSLCEGDTHIVVSTPCRTEVCLLGCCIHLQIQADGANLLVDPSLAQTLAYQHDIALVSEGGVFSTKARPMQILRLGTHDVNLSSIGLICCDASRTHSTSAATTRSIPTPRLSLISEGDVLSPKAFIRNLQNKLGSVHELIILAAYLCRGSRLVIERFLLLQIEKKQLL
jgi:hypothetical protein